MSHSSTPELLALHGVRLRGFADTEGIARRFGLGVTETATVLQDAQRRGWAVHTAFAGLSGWSLTETGRNENQRQLQEELAVARAEGEIRAIYGDFLPLNVRLLKACTDWQLKPTGSDGFAANDHTDTSWDLGVLDELERLAQHLAPLAGALATALTRFCGYHTRFSEALRRAQAGEREWVDRTHIDSCHRVWFELHEDLVATLGIDRTAEW
ncbi:transcriptional regulator [Nesterenkonia muleiensis]|uniref:transcriptional regulator n=1 Tax=Nesterenkonia muleiensis TaxID=2282648 RepID=UPI000E711869|nr:transcriptional regulator [Nesterenkonia muleiensis]